MSEDKTKQYTNLINEFPSSDQQKYIDGRSLRRTGRTVQFSTKVHPSFKINLSKAALLTGKNYNQILEESLNDYLEMLSRESKL